MTIQQHLMMLVYTISSATSPINANLQEFIIFNASLDDYTIGK
jgi:hypothetical protein